MPKPKNPPHCWCRNGWWWFQARIRGRRHQESLKTKNRAVAAARARQLYEKLRWGLGEMPEASPTVREFAERWLAEWVATERKGSDGMRLARQRISEHCRPLLGTPVREVGVGDVRRLRAGLDLKTSKRTKRPLSPQTVRHILSDLRCLFGYAKKLGVVDKNPVTGDVLPSIQKRAPRNLSDIEVARILDTCPTKYRLAVVLAIETGLRWGELHRLEWKDIDLGAGTLLVRKSKNRGIRHVVLSAAARDVLADAAPTDGQVIGITNPKNDPMVRALRRASGVDRLTWHQFRHTWACRWLRSGRSLETMMQQGAWSSEQVARIYGIADQDLVRREMNGDSDYVLTTPKKGGVVN